MKTTTILIGLMAVLVAGAASAQVTVANSGAPELVINRAGADTLGNFDVNDNILLNRLGFSSGNLGAGSEERWTAAQFKLMQAATIDGVEVNFFIATPTTLYGYAIYGNKVDAGTGEDKPDIANILEIKRNEDFSVLLGSAISVTYANGFTSDYTVTVPVGPLALPAGKYWVTFFSEDGNTALFVGAEGGSPKCKRAWRKTGVGSDYSSSNSNAFAIMNGRGNAPVAGALARVADPADFSGWTGNELNGNALFHFAYRVFSPSEATGTQLTGKVVVDGWPEDPPANYVPGDPSALMCYDLVLTDPSDGYEVHVMTMNISAVDGTFATTDLVQSGTYGVKMFVHPYQVAQWQCDPGTGVVNQGYYRLWGRPFLGADLGNVAIAGFTQDLGTLTLKSADNDLNSTIDVFDLNSVLTTFGQNIIDPCPPPWTNYFDNNDNYFDGVIDVFDLNNVLLKFAQNGPKRNGP